MDPQGGRRVQAHARHRTTGRSRGRVIPFHRELVVVAPKKIKSNIRFI